MNTQQKIQLLENLTGKKVVLKELWLRGHDNQMLVINGNKQIFENRESLIDALKKRGVDPFVEMDSDIALKEFRCQNGLVPLETFVERAIFTGKTYKIFNETICERGDNYCEIKISEQ